MFRKTKAAILSLCLCAAFILSGISNAEVSASESIEIEGAVAGISVVMNNFYAGSADPEGEIALYIKSLAAAAAEAEEETEAETEEETQAEEAKEEEEETSPYANIAVSQVGSDEGYVNIRAEANTSSEILGKIYNNCAATILETVEGEDGTWYYIQSGSVTGYIKAEYFVTGDEAEAVAIEIGRKYAMVTVSGLRLRAEPNTDSDIIDVLYVGEIYTVIGEEDGFVQISLGQDDDGNYITGYVYGEYVETYVEFDEAISIEEEQAALEEAERLAEEAAEAEAALAAAQAAAEAETAAAETTAAATTAAATEAATTTAAATEAATTAAAEEETEAQTEEETTAASSASSSSSSSAVTSATRAAIVAYAKQFVGNPYVYGGTSLTSGCDCSGFTQSVFKYFGISLPRTSKAQATVGTQISTSELQPGDLVFYASNGSIYHVAIYIGNGQIIHAMDEQNGIVISTLNYSRVYCAVSVLD